MVNRDWRESPKYKRLLEPEAVFDLNNPEHRQLLAAQLRRDAAGTLADSLTCGVALGDDARIMTFYRRDFESTIKLLEQWENV